MRRNQKKPWLLKGLLLAGVGLIAVKVAARYSKTLGTGTGEVTRWVAEKIQHTTQIFRERRANLQDDSWYEVAEQGATTGRSAGQAGSPPGNGQEQQMEKPAAAVSVNDDLTSQPRLRSNSDTYRSPEPGPKRVAKLRVTPMVYQRLRKRQIHKMD